MPPSRVSYELKNLGQEFTTSGPGNSFTYDYHPEDIVLGLGSGGNYGYPGLLGHRNIGQAFHLSGTRKSISFVDVGEIWRGGTLQQRYVGAIGTRPQDPNFPSDVSSPIGFGATAFAKMKPTKPLFNFTTSLYELRELPGMLRERFLEELAKRPVQAASKVFLAEKFGWMPLVNDIRRLFSLQKKMEKRFRWLLRHNGRPVHTRCILRDTSTTPIVQSGASYSYTVPVLVTQYYRSAPRWKYYEYDRDRIWATGRFRYWLPPGPRDVKFSYKLMRGLYGLDISPSTLYNMIPWTWLIDWFTNVGDVITNIDAGVADRLAADFCYIMREVERVGEMHTTNYYTRRNGAAVQFESHASTHKFHKWREKGDPFGFNTPENTLSGMQIAILGALGLSRLR